MLLEVRHSEYVVFETFVGWRSYFLILFHKMAVTKEDLYAKFMMAVPSAMKSFEIHLASECIIRWHPPHFLCIHFVPREISVKGSVRSISASSKKTKKSPAKMQKKNCHSELTLLEYIDQCKAGFFLGC